jgi:predicted nucleotidyltransferase component of viral defense system
VIVLTRQDVLAHQREVPWAELYQVEQDLLLCLAMHAIFSDRFLAKEVAMRGGTVLHKVHLAPAARYSEDIDLVAVGERPEEHIRIVKARSECGDSIACRFHALVTIQLLELGIACSKVSGKCDWRKVGQP